MQILQNIHYTLWNTLWHRAFTNLFNVTETTWSTEKFAGGSFQKDKNLLTDVINHTMFKKCTMSINQW
jgi:hypothetical protein